MALVTWPDFKIKTITWTLDRPANINRSQYTGKRAAAASPWHGLWTAQLQLAPIIGESNALALRAFLAAVQGAINTFRLPATEGSQLNLPAATVNASVTQGATSMVLNGAFLVAGQMLTVNDQLLMVIDASLSGSNCQIDFTPMLRAAAGAGTTVALGNPTCLVALTDSKVTWDIAPGQAYSCALSVEEVF